MTRDDGQGRLDMDEGRAARRCARDLTPGSTVAGEQYAVQSKRLVPFKNKPGQWMSLTLGDRTGSIEARIWDNAEALAETFAQGDVVVITGRVESYQDKTQVVVTEIARCPAERVRREDFVPHGARDPAQMLAEVGEVCKSVREPGLRRLLALFFAEDEFAQRFKQAPGAKRVHHAWVGGLIEHTLNVVRLCDSLCELYPQLDRDLLITGALLHDVGKVDEYSWDLTIESTDWGDLVGHIAGGYHLLRQALDQVPEVAPETRLRLEHMVIAHHGEPALGALKQPMTVEACALHYAENLDAQVNRFLSIIERERGQGRWTERDFLLERRLFMGEQGLGEGKRSDGDKP